MPKIPFKHYLHDTNDSLEFVDWLTGQGLSEEVAEAIAEQRPFYEVTFECEFDTETRKVEVLKVTL